MAWLEGSGPGSVMRLWSSCQPGLHHLMACLGWDYPLRHGSLIWLASGCWLLAKGLISSPHRLLEYPHDTEAGFPQSEQSRKESQAEIILFYNQGLEVTQHRCCHILLAKREPLILVPVVGLGSRFCLLKGKLSENFWPYFNITTYRVVKG